MAKIKNSGILMDLKANNRHFILKAFLKKVWNP